MTWQTIDTAPKDGTVVLVFADQHIAMLGRIYPHNSIHTAKWNGEAWIVAVYQDLGPSVSGPPTHWMPLPPIPHPQGEEHGQG